MPGSPLTSPTALLHPLAPPLAGVEFAPPSPPSSSLLPPHPRFGVACNADSPFKQSGWSSQAGTRGPESPTVCPSQTEINCLVLRPLSALGWNQNPKEKVVWVVSPIPPFPFSVVLGPPGLYASHKIQCRLFSLCPYLGGWHKGPQRACTQIPICLLRGSAGEHFTSPSFESRALN